MTHSVGWPLVSSVRPGALSPFAPCDVLIAISGSGNSANVLKAVRKANEMGAVTLGWSGFDGGKLADLVQKPIVINSDNMQRIEDVHMVLGHLVFSCLMQECASRNSQT